MRRSHECSDFTTRLDQKDPRRNCRPQSLNRANSTAGCVVCKYPSPNRCATGEARIPTPRGRKRARREESWGRRDERTVTRTEESRHHEDGRSTKSTAAEVTEFDGPRQSSVVAGDSVWRTGVQGDLSQCRAESLSTRGASTDRRGKGTQGRGERMRE